MNDADAQTPRPPQMPTRSVTIAPSQSWAGHYTGPLDGADGVLDIASGGRPGDYAVSLSMGRTGANGIGCAGEVGGTGRVTGDRLSFMAPIPEESLANYNGEQCRIDLVRNGQSLRVEATYACTYHHGSSCAFAGTLRKAAARTTPDGSGGTGWVTGSWARSSSECREFPFITIRSDGGYEGAQGAERGRWSVRGDALTLVALEAAEGDSEFSPLRPPETTVVRVSAPDRTHMLARYPDGTSVNFVRCR
jgi:hypothetical protein